MPRQVTEELLKAVFDELVVMCDAVDDSTQTADAALQDLQSIQVTHVSMQVPYNQSGML